MRGLFKLQLKNSLVREKYKMNFNITESSQVTARKKSLRIFGVKILKQLAESHKIFWKSRILQKAIKHWNEKKTLFM